MISMSITLGKVDAGTWCIDDDAYDPQSRVRQFTFNGKLFTAHSVRGGEANAWPMTIREAVSGHYVATVSNWSRLPEQLTEVLKPVPESGYTPCACRDCMGTTVSSDVTKPELCSECKDAGCVPFETEDKYSPSSIVFECQRNDAYGEC